MIRRLHSRGKKSEREIARLTGLSRNTVAKWLKAPVETAPKYRRKVEATKLELFHETLKQALRADARRPVDGRRTAKALYAEIKAAGYDGSYIRLTDFIREWRAGEGLSVATRAFVPLTFALGEAPGPRDAVRCAHARLRGAGRRAPARHLRLSC